MHTPRLHVHTATAGLWREQPGAHRAYLVVVAVTFAAGLLLLVCDHRRFAGPAYQAINEVGGPRWVGVALLALAVALVGAVLLTPRVVRWTLIATCAAHVLIGGSFLTSALGDVHVGPLASLYVGALAAWAISQADLYRTLQRPPG